MLKMYSGGEQAYLWVLMYAHGGPVHVEAEVYVRNHHPLLFHFIQRGSISQTNPELEYTALLTS